MQNVRELVFLQGDDAREIFDLLYPNGGVRMVKDPRTVVQYLLQFTSDDAQLPVTELDDRWGSGRVVTKDHIMVWNYAYCEIALYLKVTKKELRAKQKELVCAD